MFRPTAESANESARFSETLKNQYLDVGSIPAVSTKRGSSAIRKTGYEVMRSLKSHPMPADGAVYQFILKKEAEGKPKKVAKMAGLNKFLRIYYARVMEVYSC